CGVGLQFVRAEDRSCSCSLCAESHGAPRITRRHAGARHSYSGGFLNAQSAGGLFAQQVITLLRAR
ncbi:MAG: hypothetical protein ACYC1W_14525, partial [Gemmatimonadaceae bacterium]